EAGQDVPGVVVMPLGLRVGAGQVLEAVARWAATHLPPECLPACAVQCGHGFALPGCRLPSAIELRLASILKNAFHLSSVPFFAASKQGIPMAGSSLLLLIDDI